MNYLQFLSYKNFICLFIFIILYFLETHSVKYKKYIRYGFSALLFIFVAYLFGENLFAKWGVIDDHELFSFSGDYERITSWGDFWKIYLQTEVGNFGNSLRYRPSYYFLRILELYVWKLNPFYWYLFRILIVLLFVESIYFFISKYISYSSSFLFLLWIFSFLYWIDIFTRLGPSEIYGSLGFGLIVIGVNAKLEWNTKNIWINLLLYSGILIIMGVKENFLYFILLSFYFLYLGIKRNSYKQELVGFLVTTGYFLFILTSLLLSFKNATSDIYGNSTHLENRLSLVWNFFNQTPTKILLLLVFTSFLISIYGYYQKQIRFKKPILYIIFFFLYYILNFIFYNGVWPSGGRYNFPGVVALQMILLFSVVIYSFSFGKKKYKIQFNFLFILFLSILVNFGAINEVRKGSILNKNKTIEFTKFLKEQTDSLRDYPDKKIFLIAQLPYEYEPVFSLSLYLNYFKISNDKYLIVSSENKYKDFENVLIQSLKKTSIEGSKNHKILPFGEKKYENADCAFYVFSDLSNQNFGNDCKTKLVYSVPW